VTGASFEVVAVSGERLDVALGSDSRVGSRAAAQKLIDAGAVLVDGKVRQKRYMLRGGESIEVRPV
jgi:RNA-binding protein YlmH